MDKKIILKTDLVFSFFHFYLKIPISMIGPIFIIAALAMIPMAMLTGMWSGIQYPLKQSYTTWIGYPFLCIANIYILKYYISIPKVFNRLKEKGIITDDSESFQDFLDSFYKYYLIKYRKFIVFSISIGISFYYHLLFLTDGIHGWTEISAVDGWSILGYYHMMFFAVELNIIINFIINIVITVSMIKRMTNKVYEKRLEYNFIRLCDFHTGGLKPIGDLAVKCNFVLILVGSYALILTLSVLKITATFGFHFSWQYYEMLIPIPAILITSTFIFFMHLYPLHKLMKFRKEELLEAVRGLDCKICKLEQSFIESLSKNKDKLELFKNNSEIFEAILKLPTWPLNFQIISKLITALLIPIIHIIVGKLLKLQ